MSGYNLEQKLVIGLASSALFNLEESDAVFRENGELAYREYQRSHENQPLESGVAFPFIQRLLSLNDIFPPEKPFVEVILLSRNDPDTGLRVMNSIEHHKLNIKRAIFLQGRTPHKYINALNISLFLSANETDVNQAINAGYPAGLILKGQIFDIAHDEELRIAFDFDGVIADASSEQVYKENGLPAFIENESKLANQPANAGPLHKLLQQLSTLQKAELNFLKNNTTYKSRLRISIVTARNAPAHKRVITSLRAWGIDTVNEAFFLGGIEKRKVLEILQPHIFFDDQVTHVEKTADSIASVHIPFGIANKQLDSNKQSANLKINENNQTLELN
ncbi:5'-nucleotidase [Acinetobacter baumannii]|uniref:5'-nucleotidase n=2 Tax=Acinetobacter baumannii TaxID=470 RepID=UPI00056E7D76|nr:5'-nucleotidase [Acinetobacter baumannii]KMV26799.1 5'-nucleotidase family protein [Acinetobacter baumannii]KRJ22936.1 5'-nucleotidase [Acinetobacter baumannii]MBD0439403.1 5'-nucleotidase [Acinetobacter baumannii]MBD0493334.1 5'-nucleotidase [Acinetobacter baumannii]MBF9261141.1 5'-nucleotidase [Acinetobacter baumannii]